MHAAGNSESNAERRRLRQLELPQPQLQLPELRDIVREASRALALLDAVRLEELALSCRKLNGDFSSQRATANLNLQARQATADMAVFARVLDATRANLEVMRRLRDLRERRVEYDSLERPNGHD